MIEMTLPEAIQTLTTHQEWRMGAEIPQLDPKVISDAMYLVLAAATVYESMHHRAKVKS